MGKMHILDKDFVY